MIGIFHCSVDMDNLFVSSLKLRTNHYPSNTTVETRKDKKKGQGYQPNHSSLFAKDAIAENGHKSRP